MKALWIKIVLLAVALPGVWGNVAAQVTISADFDTGSIGSVRRIDSVRMLHAAKNSLEVMSFGIRSRIDPLNPAINGFRYPEISSGDVCLFSG